MKRIEEATLEEINQMKLIQALTNKIDQPTLGIMQTLTNTFIDQKAEICRTCGAQARFAYNRLMGWIQANQSGMDERYNQLVPTLIVPDEPIKPTNKKHKNHFHPNMLNK